MITFHDRQSMTVSELADELVLQMDMVYFYVMNGIDIEDDAAKRLFVNENGWMDAGSSYGIVLNGEGSATLSIGQRIQNTADIILQNVEIFGIYNGAIEKVKSVTIGDSDGAIRGILSDPIDWSHVLNDDDDGRYIGDAYTDIVFAMNLLQSKEEWYYLHCMRITDELQDFVLNANGNLEDIVNMECNTDIQMHTNKGAIGLRIDGVQNIQLQDIYIHDIINYADLGSDICGEYEVSTISKEDSDIQYGYTATRSHGIIVDYAKGIFDGITIENIESHYGSSWAMVVYKGCDIELRGDVVVNNIFAGSALDEDKVEMLKLPNFIPRACSVEVSEDANIFGIDYEISGDTVIGYELCDDTVQIGGCNNCYLKSENADNKISVHLNPPVWLVVIMVYGILCIIGCYIKLFLIRDLRKNNSEEQSIGCDERTPLLVD